MMSLITYYKGGPGKKSIKVAFLCPVIDFWVRRDTLNNTRHELQKK